jgi:tetratricopeptide (TPR) repeat protein
MVMNNSSRAPERTPATPHTVGRRSPRLRDAHGLLLSTDRPDSLAAYETALEALLSWNGGGAAIIDRALAADPNFVMGYALKAALLVTAADEAVEPQLSQTLRAAERLHGHANERERRHLAAAHAWLGRDLVRAIALYGEILVDYPRDSLALRVAHTGDFQLDQTNMLCKRVTNVLPQWDESLPHFGYVLGMYAFGLEEDGHYEEAESVGRRALALNSRNPGAIHAIAHVMEMQGRPRDGIAWLENTALKWAAGGSYASHLWWHLALCYFDLDDTARALAIYDKHLHPTPSRPTATLVDASALLWRLQLRGVDVADRWREVADGWEVKRLEGLRPFNDVHAMLAYVADGRDVDARRLLNDLKHRAVDSPVLDNAIRNSALPVCEALRAFGRGDYADAVERLTILRRLIERCGGSKAQCDLLHLTLLEAAFRARRTRLARALVSERIARKPASVFNRQLQVRVADRIGRLRRNTRETTAAAGTSAA